MTAKKKKKGGPKVPPSPSTPSPGAPFDLSGCPASCPHVLDAVLQLPPRRIDPALVWALLTDFKGYGGAKACDDRIPFLIEVEHFTDLAGVVLPAQVEDAPGSFHRLVVMPITYQELGKTRFATVQVMLEDIPRLLGLPCLVRAEMGLPGVEKPWLREALKPAAFPVGAWAPTTPVIATIDHGIAFLHRHFSVPPVLGEGDRDTPWRSRIVRLWDQWSGLVQSPPPNPVLAPWHMNTAFGYGRYFDAADIAPYLGLPGDELAQYHALEYEPAAQPASHGTHVLDVAAGPFNRALGVAGMQAPAEPAAALPIIAVQLPWLPEKDVSGASLCVHVLDALRFILDSAAPASPRDPSRNIVVNLSDGALCGSHNAGSTIEAAIDELLEKNPNLSLVLAAGNAYDARTHAQGTLAPNPAKVSLAWQVLPGDRTESFIEVWMPSGSDVRITLETPQQTAIAGLSVDQVAVWPPSGTPEVLAAAVYQSEAATGIGQVARIALRPTRPPNPGDLDAPHGLWRVALSNHESHPVRFDAWIQRDDPPFATAGPRRQSTFLAGETPGISGQNTLNSLGTGELPIVVGGYRLNDGGIARYSSSGGPLDLAKLPTVVGVSDEGVAMQGLRAAGNRSGATVRMNGTSVAAPGITRIVANALDAAQTQPIADDTVKKALRAAAQMRVPPSEPDLPGAAADVPLRVGSGWLDPTAVIAIP